jgi:hypothetical protein
MTGGGVVVVVVVVAPVPGFCNVTSDIYNIPKPTPAFTFTVGGVLM